MTVLLPFRAKASLLDEETEHRPSPDCWCCPTELEDGVYLHHERVPADAPSAHLAQEGERSRWERAQAMGKGLALLHALKPSSRA